ncbi:MAG: hypothetical protein H6707_12375 [Deltaproteobacteria bacterium]|nr:hypothetical protein [Deltaproteobacteria bacterium]
MQSIDMVLYGDDHIEPLLSHVLVGVVLIVLVACLLLALFGTLYAAAKGRTVQRRSFVRSLVFSLIAIVAAGCMLAGYATRLVAGVVVTARLIDRVAQTTRVEHRVYAHYRARYRVLTAAHQGYEGEQQLDRRDYQRAYKGMRMPLRFVPPRPSYSALGPGVSVELYPLLIAAAFAMLALVKVVHSCRSRQ